MTRPALPSLTGLRAVAAGLVFAFHVAVVEYVGGPAGAVWGGVVSAGSSGVSLFFVLSGFVLGWSHDPRTRRRDFLLRRVARVWPAHAAWWGVVLLASAAGHGVGSGGPGAAVANLALVSAWRPGWWQAGNPVAWSLVCEAFFYAAFPLLRAGLSRVSSRRAAVGTAVGLVAASWLLPVLLWWVGLVPSPGAGAHHPLGRWPEFALGVGAALAVRRGAWRGCRLRTAVPVAVAGYVLATITAPLPGLTVVPHVLLVVALARRDLAGGGGALAGRRARYLGEVSYAFYLCHLLVVVVLGSLAVPGHLDGHPRLPVVPAVALGLAALGASLLAAAATHRWVEVPSRRWLLHRAGGLRAERHGGAQRSLLRTP